MLRDDLKEVQNTKQIYYNMQKYFLNKLFDNTLTYIDYVNMCNIKKEIEKLNKKGSEIVKQISLGN